MFINKTFISDQNKPSQCSTSFTRSEGISHCVGDIQIFDTYPIMCQKYGLIILLLERVFLLRKTIIDVKCWACISFH